jgi:hypothetical protein
VGRADAPIVGRVCGEGRDIAVEVGDPGAGLVAELKAHQGHDGAGVLLELLIECLERWTEICAAISDRRPR